MDPGAGGRMRGADQVARSPDPYSLLKVKHGRSPVYLYVDVVRGRNISKTKVHDKFHTPDAYVIVTLTSECEEVRKTKPVNNDANPKWMERFLFLVDEERFDNKIDVKLLASHKFPHSSVGTETITLSNLRDYSLTPKPFILKYHNGSVVEVMVWTEIDNPPALRYSLALCDDEKQFLRDRKLKVFHSMRRLLPPDVAPANLNEVPTVAVLGSGGGFRALAGFSGAWRGLASAGVVDVVTYAAAVSGSSWWLSSLYSQPGWAGGDASLVQAEIGARAGEDWRKRLVPPFPGTFMPLVKKKKEEGQPVSFVDVFGYLIGETLIRGRLDCKLSDVKEKVVGGSLPLPLYACLYVKEDVSALHYHEWIEFSPYEVGMASHGTFMPPELFGSQFYMGHVRRRAGELPLNYLQSVWGSAFSILFKRVAEEMVFNDKLEDVRGEIETELEKDKLDANAEKQDGDDEQENSSKVDGNGDKKGSFWYRMRESFFGNIKLTSTRMGRAGLVHNFMHGLTLDQLYPLSPWQPAVELTEPVKPDLDTLSVVDGGLAFNSPYPPLLRPQRGVDLYISYDFSARDKDLSNPFEELKLAEKWAQEHQLPFPPIDVGVYEREGMKECYVFSHPTDPRCPIVIHFVLVNLKFRDFKEPGVPRETDEERKFGDFSIFEDPENPYSTFNFIYKTLAFSRLADLMQFNTLLYADVIREEIGKLVLRKRRAKPPPPCGHQELEKLKRVVKVECDTCLEDCIAAFHKGEEGGGTATSPPHTHGHDVFCEEKREVLDTEEHLLRSYKVKPVVDQI